MIRFPRPCKKRIVAGAVLGLVAACATTVNVSGRFPAKVPAAAELRTIAVSGFEGSGGDRFAAALEAHLASIRFDGQPYFTLMGGAHERVLDSASAIRYGKSTGAAAVYFGRIDAVTESARVQRSQQSDNCAEWKKNGKCKRYHEYQVTCEERTFTLTVLPKTVKVATGAIVYSRQSVGTAKTTYCPGSSGQSDSELVSIAERAVLAAIGEDVAPQNKSMRAKISKDADGLGEADAASFGRAGDSMEAGNAAAACDTWKQIDQTSPGHRPTLLNLGVCAEIDGRYPDALALYESARAEPVADADAADDGVMQQTLSVVTSVMNTAIRADADAAINRVRGLISAEGELAEAEQKRAAAVAAGKQKLADEAAAVEHQRAADATTAAKAKAAADAATAQRRKDLADQYGEAAAEAILKGEILKGMSKDAVLAARGKPASKEVLSPSEEIWTYGDARVIFADGKVSYVGK